MRAGRTGLLGCAFLFAGCGGSDYPADVPNPPQPGPAGYYAGTLVDSSGIGVDAVALVTEDGKVRIVDTVLDSQFLSTLPASGSDWQASFKGYAGPLEDFPDGTRVCSGRVDAAAFAAAELLGDYTCGGDSGSFDLVYNDDISFNPPDVAELTGEAQGLILPHDFLLFIIAPDGTYSGSDTAGCIYTGSFTAADPIIDLYAMRLIQTCGTTVLKLSGTAVLGVDPQGGGPALYYGVSDTKHSLAGVLFFQ